MLSTIAVVQMTFAYAMAEERLKDRQHSESQHVEWITDVSSFRCITCDIASAPPHAWEACGTETGDHNGNV